MKKILVLLLASVFLSVALSGCNDNTVKENHTDNEVVSGNEAETDNEKTQVETEVPGTENELGNPEGEQTPPVNDEKEDARNETEDAENSGEADTNTEDEADSTEYDHGTRSGNTYKSKWAGIKYSVSGGLEMLSDDDLNTIMGVKAGVDYSSLPHVYEFYATDMSTGNAVFMMTQKIGNSTVDDYIASIKAQVSDIDGVEAKFVEGTVSSVYGGIEFERFDVVMTTKGTTAYQSYLLKIKDQRMVVISASSLKDTFIDEAFNAIKAY